MSPDQQRDPVEVLCEEFLDRWRRGEAPSIEEYAASHESYREGIQSIFPAMLAMETLKKERSQSCQSRPVQLHVERLRQLGDFRILREIGRGGMAIVYEAEQQSLDRRVAVKVFPQQVFEDSRQLRRFEREARTVAGLHHNNIVPVFGTGEQDGLYYFVMQLLDGISLDRVIAELRRYAATESGRMEPLLQIIKLRTDSRRGDCSTQVAEASDTIPPTRCRSSFVPEVASDEILFQSSRMEPAIASPMQPSSHDIASLKRDISHWRLVANLGRQVAEGLQYAHAAGVLHRDIKPANLIVDADWRVWITDFGLATELSQERLSSSGDVVGTLRYMAPERLQGQADVRSDIYSLGLTLYELLTLQPAVHGRSRGEITRQLLHGSPVTPRSLCRDIPADLETIILKAISREPSLRYQSACEFANDLKNFAEDRPILARRVTRLERLHRWSRRNPLLASLSAALLVSVTVSLAAITVHWQKAVRETARAQAESARAEGNLALALKSMDRFLERFEADWMEHPVAPDMDDTGATANLRFVVSDHSAAVLQEALSFYEEFTEQNATNPKLQRDTAKAYQRAGGIYERLGQYQEAERAYRNGLAILWLINSDSRDAELSIAIAEAHNRLAMVLNAQYQHQAARVELSCASSLLTTRLADHASCQRTQYTLALIDSNLGSVLWWSRNLYRSTRKHRSAIRILEGLVEEHPDDAAYRLALARAYRKYYRLAVFQRDRDYPREIRNSAEDLLENLVADYPAVPDYRCEFSEMLTMNGIFGDHKQKLEHVNKAIELADDLVEEYASIPRYRAAYAKALSVKAGIVEEQSLADAAQFHSQAVKLYAELCEQYPGVVDYLAFSAMAHRDQAKCLEKMDRIAGARMAAEAAVNEQKTYLEKRPRSMFGKRWLADYLSLQAELERACGNDATAEACEQEAQAVRSRRR